MLFSLNSLHSEMKSQISELKDLLSVTDNRIPRVSKWSCHQHVDHMTKVMKVSLSNLLEGERLSHQKPKPNLKAWYVLITGSIPRGRVQAPEIVMPDTSSAETLLEELRQLEELVERLATKDKDKEFKKRTMRHPALGILGAPHWVRFLKIHNDHHLRIIRELES